MNVSMTHPKNASAEAAQLSAATDPPPSPLLGNPSEPNNKTGISKDLSCFMNQILVMTAP
jgi:hypothetical protein